MFQAIIQTWKNVPNYCAISTKLEKMFQAIVQFPQTWKNYKKHNFEPDFGPFGTNFNGFYLY